MSHKLINKNKYNKKLNNKYSKDNINLSNITLDSVENFKIPLSNEEIKIIDNNFKKVYDSGNKKILNYANNKIIKEQLKLIINNIIHNQKEILNKKNENISKLKEAKNTYFKDNKIFDILIHEIGNKDWSDESYIKIMKIKTVNDFWSFINNHIVICNNFMNYHCYIMNENVYPSWDSSLNKSVYSIRIDVSISYELFTIIALYYATNNILNNNITGISFNPKNNFVLIKIYSSENTNNINKIKKLMNTKDFLKFEIQHIKYQNFNFGNKKY